jgi:hypothetical protein
MQDIFLLCKPSRPAVSPTVGPTGQHPEFAPGGGGSFCEGEAVVKETAHPFQWRG